MKHKLFIIAMGIILVMTMSPVSSANADELDTEAALAPAEVTAKGTRKATIVVEWSEVPEAASYYVYRAKGLNGSYKCIKKTGTAKFTDKKIHPKATYYYRISTQKLDMATAADGYYSETAEGKLRIKKSFRVKAYAYSGGGRTKTGKKAKVGRIAVDPKVIKLGTWLYVEGYGICQACDIGSDIKGRTIDVYKRTGRQAVKWGVRKPKVYIIR